LIGGGAFGQEVDDVGYLFLCVVGQLLLFFAILFCNDSWLWQLLELLHLPAGGIPRQPISSAESTLANLDRFRTYLGDPLYLNVSFYQLRQFAISQSRWGCCFARFIVVLQVAELARFKVSL
jgi:hypothetical protein